MEWNRGVVLYFARKLINHRIMNKFLIGLGVFALLVIVWGVSIYNNLVTMDVKIDESWSQVEVQYQRRFDVIPNLVETVKGVANFESSTYIAVSEARSAWTQALKTGTRSEQIAATGNVESSLARLLVSVENYPQLKANENFQTLQAQIEGTENRVATARRDFNTAVTPYNTTIRRFPASFIARMFGFEHESFFESAAGSETAPAVNFDQP